MTFSELTDYVAARNNVLFTPEPNAPQPFWYVAAEHLVALAETLRSDEQLYFDQLACLTAIDNGPEAGQPGRSAGAVATLDVVYNFYSIPYGHALMVRVTVPRDDARVPTLSHLWRTADWHEREAFDLVGVTFVGHPDLRRILLPADWPGHPLRKDYTEPERYHGIQTT